MKRLTRWGKKIWGSKTNKVMLIAGAFVMVALSGALVLNVGKIKAADCDNNAIMRCGFNGAADFITKAQANAPGDLPAVYADYGLVSSQYSRFVTSAKLGTAYKDGRIVVDGQTVATNSTSIGRLASFQGSGYFTKVINGHTYYGNTNAQAFASDALPVMVMFNAQGVMQFAVLTSCGNPMTGTKVTPTYACNLLQKSAVAGKANTYSFTTSASAGNGATIAKVVYDFGDGTTVAQTSPTTPVEHTYTTGGTFTAKVTVYVNLPGSQVTTVTSAQCATQITVVMPFYSCVQLLGAAIESSKTNFRFTATARFGGGATFTSAMFNFGDTTNATVTPSGMIATTDHNFSDTGSHTVIATLTFNTGMSNQIASVTCQVTVSSTQPPQECKPGVPMGSPECLAPCQPGSSVPPESPQCETTPPPTTPTPTPPTTPAVLPNTGAGNVIGLFAGAVVAGTIGYRLFLSRKLSR